MKNIIYNSKNKLKIINYYNENKTHPDWSMEDFSENGRDIGSINAMLAYKLNGDLINGSYIEIGTGHYEQGSNTYLLEKKYGWKGLSIDISKQMVDVFNENRSNKCVEGDAITFNWEKYLEENNFPKQIDYLSLDVDYNTHSHANLLSLLNFPITKYKFNIISIEHLSDIHYNLRDIKDTQRSILSALGYHLVIRGYNNDLWALEEPNSNNGFYTLNSIFRGENSF